MFFNFIILITLMVLELTIRFVEENERNNEELINVRRLIRMIQLKIITLMTKELLLIAFKSLVEYLLDLTFDKLLKFLIVNKFDIS